MPIVIHNHWIDKIAVLAGVVSGFALYPQVYALIMSGTAANVSVTTFFIIFINSFVWLVYSVHRALFSLAIPSILNILASGTLIAWYFSV